MLRVFLAIQALGVLGILIYLASRESIVGSVSAFLALVALFPGNLLGSWSVERLLWPSTTTRAAIQVLSTAAGIAINALIWLLVARLWLAFRREGPWPAA
jgi:hypothetical protein